MQLDYSQLRMILKQGENEYSIPPESEYEGIIYFIPYAEDLVFHGFDVSSPINVLEVLMGTEVGEIVVWHM